MSRSESAAELSMEDILASIRSLVPADQRGDGPEAKVPPAPPVPPTTNRMSMPSAPPTLPLGALPPQRVASSFDDDLGDLLDDPSETPAPGRTPAPQPAASEPPKAPTLRPLPDFDAIFARTAPQPSQTPSLAPGSPMFEPPPPQPLPVATVSVPQSVDTERPALSSPTPPADDAFDRAPPSAPPPPSLMGYGQSTGFVPPPFGKRPASTLEVQKAESAVDMPAPAAPAAMGIPPLKRSFFPASFRAPEPSVPPPVEPVFEAPSARIEAPMEARGPEAAAPVPAQGLSPVSAPAPADERPNYSDALDQALKRLQGFGSHVPEGTAVAAPPPRAEAPKPPQNGFDLNPRLFGAIPPHVPVEDVQQASAAEPVASFEATPAPMQPVEVSSEVVPAAAPASAFEPAAVEAAPAPADVPVVEIEAPQTSAPQPTVRLSDALWSKSAPSMASDVAADAQRPEASIPETVELIDVPAASPVVKAFGALALGLAGGGTAPTSSFAPAFQSAAPSSLAEPVSVLAEDVPQAVAEATPSVELQPVVAPEPQAVIQPEAGLPVAQSPEASQPAAAPPAGRSLEDMVADMLRPMLQQWIEDNMPRIMEKALRAETGGKRD